MLGGTEVLKQVKHFPASTAAAVLTWMELLEIR